MRDKEQKIKGYRADREMARQLLVTQALGGRARLQAGLFWRQLLWRLALNWAVVVKRGFDVAGSILLGLALLPLLLVIALCIKLEDGGPIFFTQTRVGKFGSIFKMYKFRSMCLDAEKWMGDLLSRNQHSNGITFKIKDDPRITRTGRWLRKFSFDELPQLLNVFSGEMSLVGPRPPLPREVALYTIADRRRLDIIPGITCFWQINGRAELDFPKQVCLDLLYIEQQSFWTDLRILFKTIPAILRGKGAY